MKHNIKIVTLSLAGAVLLSGCETPPPAADGAAVQKAPVIAAPAGPVESTDQGAVKPIAPPPVAQPVVPPEPSPSEKALTLALATYERGEYALAIRQLTPLTTDSALGSAERVLTMKTLAFSQCLSRALTACRRTFEHAFRLDQKFELAPAERGHPVWGPQYDRARKNVLH